MTDTRSMPCFSLSNRLRRLAWFWGWLLLARWTPRPCHAWRVAIVRLFGGQIGRQCHIYPSVRIWAPWQLTMGDHACLGDEVQCYNQAPVILGARAIVSQQAFICTGTHDYTNPSHPLIARDITIGAEAWICAQAFIGPGVTIADGAVVGARAVVTKNMPAWTVCAGHPCVPIKPRIMIQNDKE